ncbi:MAG TPA: cytochrome c oxidase subunit 3 [Thermoplasmata archaeon]|jgi:heme/copper-type cytochrome/quinol oxidase subunit 3|nr:cytochrome c oxidase subunit 3 [Thermoplasmata archaeon]
MAHPEPMAAEGEEEHHGSPWPVIIAVGMGVGYVGIVSASIPMLLLGVAIFGSGTGGWIHQDLQRPSSAFYGLAAAVESRFPRVSARKLGIWLFLVTEIMFFSAIIGSSWTLRLRTSDPTLVNVFQGPWATPGEILNVPLTGANTFILICSSLTMVEALAAIERGDQAKLKLFSLATLLLGITFLSIQAFEYQHLYFGEGLTFASAPKGVNPLYGPTFYAQTGVHGSHVSAGVIGLAYVTRKAFKGGFTKENHEAVELAGLYWHFVDVVWIFLFTIVYLI